MSAFNLSPLHEKVCELFGADLRSLALLRVSMAALILVDLMRRSRDLVAHYTDFGVFPRAALLDEVGTRWSISVHLSNGTWQFQALLFFVAGVFALALLVGYRTRVATIVSWFMLASLHSRNYLLLDGGDVLLRVILFWAIFLPWGASWSVDRALSTSNAQVPERTLSAATFAYVAQIVFVYWFSVLHKTGPEWRSEGNVIYYTLQFDQFVRPVGQYLLQFPFLLKVMTHSVFWFEILGPLLLFSPVWTGPIRTASIFAFVLMHLGIGLCMNIGLFTWIAAFSMMGLLPSWFWEKILRRVETTERLETRVYYDRDCSFCSRAIRLAKTFLLLPRTVAAPAQSDPTIEAEMRLNNSWVVIDQDGSKHFRFKALNVLMSRSPWAWPLAPVFSLLLANRTGDRIYEVVANHRKSECPLDIAPPQNRLSNLKLGFPVSFLVLFLVGYVFMWNVATLPNAKYWFSERSRAIGDLLRIDQLWNMFATSPINDGWYVIPGKLKSGEVVDLFRNGEPLTWKKPTSVASLFESYRWWKYLFTIRNIRNEKPWRNYASYLCRSWNANHRQSETLEEVQIMFVLERTMPNNRTRPPEPILYFTHRCGNEN